MLLYAINDHLMGKNMLKNTTDFWVTNMDKIYLKDYSYFCLSGSA